jgi:hypothetical protein
MKKVKILTYSMMALMLIFSVACDSDEGATGPAGANGTNGTDGTDGQDGNANVQTYTFDVSAESGIGFNLTVPEITQDVLDNDVILHYINIDTVWYPVPGTGYNGNHIVRAFNILDYAIIRFVDFSGLSTTITAGTYETVKVIIIESSSTTAGKNSLSSTQQFYNELENAGVDINNYEDVMDYYGLEY